MNLKLFRSLITLLCLAFTYYVNPLLAEDIKTTKDSEYIIKEDIFNKSNKKVNVKSKGIGKSLEEAKEDAVINAISKVVGTFFDSNSKIKLKKISDGKRTDKLKEISKEYFTYNRGNIYNFEVTKIENKDNIYYIEALVDVIKENIEDYIEEFTSGESIVDLEVNTIKESRAKLKKQKNNLFGNLLERKNDLEYKYISHGKGQLLENFSFLSYCQKTLNKNKNFCDIFKGNFDLEKDCFLECIYSDRQSVANEIEKYKAIKDLRKPHNIFVLPFRISLRDDYKKIYKNLFNEISNDTRIIKYSDKNLVEVSENTIDFIENNFKEKEDEEDRLIIFNENKEALLTNFYIKKNVKNIDLYDKLFSKIDYQDPRLALLIKDKFKNIKKTIFFDSSISVNTPKGLCGKNNLMEKFLIPNCVSNNINEAKIISFLNDLPISKGDELSLINNVKNEYFRYSPIVVSSEKNYLLLLNLTKFELDKDDSISLEFEYKDGTSDDREIVFRDKKLAKEDKKKQKGFELKTKINKRELELAEQKKKEVSNRAITTVNYKNGRYEGELLYGKFHGQGTFFWNSGDKYIGKFLNGKFHGQGTFFYKNGDKYIGEYLNGKKHGEGTYTWGLGRKWAGDKYQGGWRYGDEHGLGTYFYSDGSRYVGNWRNGKKYGQGTYFYTDGRSERQNW